MVPSFAIKPFGGPGGHFGGPGGHCGGPGGHFEGPEAQDLDFACIFNENEGFGRSQGEVLGGGGLGC